MIVFTFHHIDQLINVEYKNKNTKGFFFGQQKNTKGLATLSDAFHLSNGHLNAFDFS